MLHCMAMHVLAHCSIFLFCAQVYSLLSVCMKAFVHVYNIEQSLLTLGAHAQQWLWYILGW